MKYNMDNFLDHGWAMVGGAAVSAVAMVCRAARTAARTAVVLLFYLLWSKFPSVHPNHYMGKYNNLFYPMFHSTNFE